MPTFGLNFLESLCDCYGTNAEPGQTAYAMADLDLDWMLFLEVCFFAAMLRYLMLLKMLS